MADHFSQTKPQIRLGQSGHLKTIVEDKRESHFDATKTVDYTLATAGRQAIVNQARPTRYSHHGIAHRAISPRSTNSSRSSNSWLRQTLDFDDLYDATDEDDDGQMSDSCPSLCSQGNSESTKSSGVSTISSASRNKYPAIIIPSTSQWANINSFHKNSPVPPTPPPKIPVSPEALSRLPRLVPEMYAPPSLDGSAASDQPSTLSAPQTPELEAVEEVDWDAQYLRFHLDSDTNGDLESPRSATMSPQVEIEMGIPEDWSHILGHFPRIPENEVEVDEQNILDIPEINRPSSTNSSNKGVELPTTALTTLQYIELENDDDDDDQNSDFAGANEIGEMEEVKLYSTRSSSMNAVIPVSAITNPFTPLSIPSPGGFFSSLGGDARHTWCLSTMPPPSSATAENFYNCPWNLPMVTETLHHTTYPLSRSKSTSLATLKHAPMDSSQTSRGSNGGELNSGINHIVDEYDELYDEELKFQASSNLDRTSVWLAAQTTYLSALRETNPVNKVEGGATSLVAETTQESFSSAPRKSVGLATILENGTCSKFPHLVGGNAMFYRGFQRLAPKLKSCDAFLHSNIRLESVQAMRRSFMDKHIDNLLGKYALNAPVRPPYRGPFSQAPRNSTVPQILADQAKFSQLEKDQDVAHQLRSSMWAVEALKFLKGGCLLPTPAVKRLDRAKASRGRLESATARRIRILDLGGDPSCGWAWHVSNEYRNVKVYTAITKHQVVNSGLKGPSNHRKVSVPNIWRLPFRDNQFDIISSRTFHALLKMDRPCGEEKDEYDLCLEECFRCLKPGGIFEFFLMDSEIIRAGSYGAAVSVEFGFNLKTRGYDPAPTKSFMGRLQKADFASVKRAWMFLPLGEGTPTSQTQPGTPSEPGEIMGNTSNIASTTGMLGGWMWEQWMLKLQMEMGREQGKLLEEVPGAYAEGQSAGAGWRCLTGWAMKPKKNDVPV
ncbi:hypothetical protein AJ78_05901 [Emergomyces pasteurianus Ep9510]|uniref:Methyltransferase type 11 domain-containing protein n=1 Tax=Emergomyces pasteurianus Ep9510 TaxID=1447872 RepID=A0A1J9PAS9_9EURO|nr:hypothetical protein AJ78_05901 [Emergomyces pasteurianus Ep9510]